MGYQAHLRSCTSPQNERCDMRLSLLCKSCSGLQVIRGTAAAPLSQLLTALEPQLRSAAGLSAWQVISPAHGSAAGRLEIAEQLRDVQHSRYMQPTVLLVDSVGGDEDVPEVSRMHMIPPKGVSQSRAR